MRGARVAIPFALFMMVVLMFPAQGSAQQWAGIVDPSRAVDWSKAGIQGGVPARLSICAALKPGVTAAQINAAIASCRSGQVVFLAAGTYNLSSGIDFGGAKSNVTLRGAGADKTFLIFSASAPCKGFNADICIEGADLNFPAQPENTATWTAVSYAKGQTQITMSNVANLSVGAPLILDQLDDTVDSGDIVVCENPGSPIDCNDDTPYPTGGSSSGQRTLRAQEQIVTVTAINGNVVTFTPGLAMSNWRPSQAPGAWWASHPAYSDGVEHLSMDHTASDAQAGITILDCLGCWVKGVRSVNSDRSHVWVMQSPHTVVRDSYFFGTKNEQSQSYGVELYPSADSLIENNIFQQIASAQMVNAACSGCVIAYNFTINDFETSSPPYLYQSVWMHAGGIDNLLLEGNIGTGLYSDLFHGSHNFVTVFRNRFQGWEPGKVNHTNPIAMWQYSRFYNIVGNVLGATDLPHNNYQCTPSDCPATSDLSIYVLGTGTVACCLSGDANVARTLFRWGNYDIVNNSALFLASEVPSGIVNFSNPVPSSQTLPASFYLSGKPSWWPAGKPWPNIGPDVTGGNIPNVAGHAFTNPAEDCYTNRMSGPADGSGSVLSFSAGACYGVTPAQPKSVGGAAH